MGEGQNPSPNSIGAIVQKFKIPVLIAVNTYDGHQYCREAFVENLLKIERDSGADVVIFYNGQPEPWGFEKWPKVYYHPQSGELGIQILCAKNNLMREYFLAHPEYSYLFMLESDIIPPPDTVRKFYGYHLDAVTAIYFVKTLQKELVAVPFDTEWNIATRKENGWEYEKRKIKSGTEMLFLLQSYIPAIWGFDNGKSALWRMEDVFPQRGLVRIFSAGIGAVMLKRKVLEVCGRFEISDPTNEVQNFTDFIYFKKVHDNGFQAFADTNTICRHDHYDFDSFVKKRWFDTKTLEKVDG